MSQPDYSHSFTKIFRRSSYETIDPNRSTLSAQGKSVVISGGHTGIGYAIAKAFAAAGAASVVLLGRRENVLATSKEQLQQAHPATSFTFYVTSIIERHEIDEAFKDIRKTAEPDILVTSAAYFSARSEALQTPLQELSASFDTNVIGNLNLVQAFLNSDPNRSTVQGTAPTSSQEKTILDVSSSSTCVFIPQNGAYSASKLAFTRLMAIAQVESSISTPGRKLRIHSFHPGNILTQPVRDAGFDESTYPWEDPELAGNFAVWLASPEAEFLKGRFVWSNWDAQELLQRKEDIESQDLLKIGVIGGAEWPGKR